MSSFQKKIYLSADSAQDRGDRAMEPSAYLRRSSDSKQVASGDLVKWVPMPVCPQFLTRSAFSPRWHLDQRPSRGTFIQAQFERSQKTAGPPPSRPRWASVSTAGLEKLTRRPSCSSFPYSTRSRELYFRNCPILCTFYEFQPLYGSYTLDCTDPKFCSLISFYSLTKVQPKFRGRAR